MTGWHPDISLRRMVEAMAACGVSEPDIARVMGVDLETLRAHHWEELETGEIIANAKVAESLLRKAIGDGPQSVAAAMFWLKTRAGWSETVVQPGDRVSARIEAMSDAELDAAIAEFQRKIEMTARNMGNDG